MTIASLIVNVGANIQGLAQSVDQIHGKFDSVVSGAQKAAGIAAAAFAGMNLGENIRKQLDRAGNIKDTAEQLGITAEAVQRLSFAASQGGSNIGTVATAMGNMANALGGNKAAELLASVGLTFNDIKNQSPDQTFKEIADAIARIPDPLRQADVARDIFGRGALELLPAMKAGFDDVGKQISVIPGHLIDAAEKSGDNLQKIHDDIDNLKARALLPLVNAFTSLPESVQVGAAGILEFMPSIETLTMAIISAGGPKAALTGLASIFTTTLPSAITGLVAFIPGAFAGMLAFFTTTLPAAIGTIIAFLGPQGLIALGVLALVGIWLKWGDDITAVVKKVYAAVKEWVVDKWTDLKTALGGSLGGAAKLFLDFHLKVLEYARLIFEGVKNWLVDKFNAIVDKVKGLIQGIGDKFKWLYDTVVGHSTVPDLVNGIAKHFARLEDVMVNPTKAATSIVEGCFGDLMKSVNTKIDGWIQGIAGKFGGLGGIVQNALGGIMGSLTGGLSSLITGGIGSLVGAIGNKLRGGEEGTFVNPNRDRFVAQFAGQGGLDAALTNALIGLGDTQAGNTAHALVTALARADKIDSFRTAEQAIASVFSRGGQDIEIFHKGGMVPGTGNVPAILQGGERVLNRDETQEYNRGGRVTIDRLEININGANKDGRQLAIEIARELPRVWGMGRGRNAARFALGIA